MSSSVINIDPEILGGTPVFRGTRVRIETLFDHLEDGVSLDEFLEDFATRAERAGNRIVGIG